MEVTVTPNGLSETLALSQVVVVDLWAPWCGPCRMLAPVVSEIAEEYDGKITVAKCNVDDCQDIAMEYGVMNIPTLLYFKDGKLADRTIGYLSKTEITNRINKLL